MTTTPPGMPGPDDHHHVLPMLGAYALGHLDETGQGAVEGHVAGCVTCRGELAAIAVLAAPLAELDADQLDEGVSAADLEPSDAGFAAILTTVRSESPPAATPPAATPPRRRLVSLVETGPLATTTSGVDVSEPLDAPTIVTSAAFLPASEPARDPAGADTPADAEPPNVTTISGRRRPRPAARLAMAAACVAIALAGVAAGFGLGAGFSSGEPVGETVAVQALEPGVTAGADVVAHSWGVEMQLTATGFTTGQVYRVEVLDTAGRTTNAGAFLGTGEREMRCRLNSSVLRGDATGFVVTDSAGAPVLVSRFT